VSPRWGAALALLVLGAALVAVIAVTTPWAPLPAGSAAADVPAGTASDSRTVDFTAAERDRADSFSRQARTPQYVSLGVGLLVVAGLGLTPWGARLVQAVTGWLGTGWAGHWTVRVLLGGVVLALLTRLVALPFDARTFAVRREAGLSTQTWPAWLADAAKGWALSTGLLLLVLVAVYALVRALPRMWWAPTAAGAAGLVLALSFLYPVLVEPVFNTFTPMPDGPLRTSLVQLAEDDEVPVDDVLVADASRRTTSLNAYVSGFGATRRIVVYDTLVRDASPAEVRLVVAHELGHAKDDDVLHGTLVGALGAAAAVCALYLLLSAGPVLRRAGVSALAEPRSLALVLAAVTLGTTIAGPVQMLVSRRIEARADVHALTLTRDPAAFAAMQRRLAVRNVSALDPNPVVFALFASHPSAPQRIALARRWAAGVGLPVPPPLAGTTLSAGGSDR
jgi:STE24 endopeptidase